MKFLRHLLPKTLFARALMIVVLPTVLVQLVSVYIFYDRHWDNVTRHMANSLAGEIAFLAYEAAKTKRSERDALTWVFEETTGISSSFEKGNNLPPETEEDKESYLEYRRVLGERLDLPFSVHRDENEGTVETHIQLSDGILSLKTSSKRLESGTPQIFMLWTIGSSFIFLLIALFFLRNQVRPIRQLAEAAEQFGKGQDIPSDFKPHGAAEVRRAARAFLVMRERLLRQIRSRTEMLAGISHDLRTPLTRMRLQLAMLAGAPEAKEMEDDVTQMEHMIREYLDFARGDGGEESVIRSLREVLESLLADYRRTGSEIPLTMLRNISLQIRPRAFNRMMQNLIDNALRYGKSCALEVRVAAGKAEILVDDAGPGIAPARREEVFRPFTRLEHSRNFNTGGVGLGLTIARDIARAHGGNIRLADAPAGGLRVVVRLPL